MTTTIQTLVESGNVTTEYERAYTRGAWKGKLFKPNMSTKEIVSIMRKMVKERFPECKFSITSKDCNHIALALMASPFEVFATPSMDAIPLSRSFRDSCLYAWEKSIEKGHHDVNHYYVANDYTLSEKGKEIMGYLVNLANAFNFDDSDAQCDYFSTNFYLSLSIGKWDKPYIKTN